MSQYRKLIAAAVGLVVVYLQKKYQIDLFGTEDLLTDFLVNSGVLLAVWGVPNAPAEPKA